MAYTPPVPGSVDFDLTGGYTPPAAGVVHFNLASGTLQAIHATGIYDGAVGAAAIRNHHEFISVSGQGIFSETFGATNIRGTKTVTCTGFTSTVFGATVVSNYKQYVEPPSIVQEEFGDQFVSNKHRVINAIGFFDEIFTSFLTVEERPHPPTQTIYAAGFTPTTIGAHEISNYYRWVYPAGIARTTAFGSTVVGVSPRYIFPPWFSGLGFGTPIIGYAVPISAIGIESTLAFGTASAILGNSLYPDGIPSSLEVPWPIVGLSPLYITTTHSPVDEAFGTTVVRLNTQIVYQTFDYSVAVVNPVSERATIENRNKTIDVAGINSLKFQYGPTVTLNARLIEPPTIGELSQVGHALVTHYRRTVYPEGFIDTYFGRGTAVYNNAQLLPTNGWESSVVGQPENVESNLQTIRTPVFGGEAFGTAYIDFGVRVVVPRGIEAYFRVGEPNVELKTRYIQVPSIYQFQMANPELFGPFHLTVITRSIYRNFDWFGEAVIINKTPQIYARSIFPEDPPLGDRHYVGHDPQYVIDASATVVELFGQTVIADRRQTIVTGVFFDELVDQYTLVQQETIVIPSTQVIEPEGWILLPTGFGIPYVDGSPYPEGIDSMRFGTHWVRVMGISPYWIWPSSQFGFGLPHINRRQTIAPQSINQFSFPRQHVNPELIYCTLDVPQQAIDNNPQSRLFVEINFGHPEDTSHAKTGEYMGKPYVYTATVQTLTPSHLDPSDMEGETFGPETSVVLGTQTVIPFGWRDDALGTPVMEPHAQRIFTLGILQRTVNVGSHTIGHSNPFWTQTIFPNGILDEDFDLSHIENFNRTVYPSGFTTLVFGNNYPMVYHPRHVYPEAFEVWVFGTAIVDNNPRYVVPVGFDGFDTDYSIGAFGNRTEVRHDPPVENGPTLFPGWDSLQMGTPTVSQRLYIRPYMIAPPNFNCKLLTVSHGV